MTVVLRWFHLLQRACHLPFALYDIHGKDAQWGSWHIRLLLAKRARRLSGSGSQWIILRGDPSRRSVRDMVKKSKTDKMPNIAYTKDVGLKKMALCCRKSFVWVLHFRSAPLKKPNKSLGLMKWYLSFKYYHYVLTLHIVSYPSPVFIFSLSTVHYL